MNRFTQFIEKNFSLVLTIGVPLGLIFPYFSFLKDYLTYLLMLVLFITFLRIDISEIVVQLKKPLKVVYAIVIHLFALPLIVFAFLSLFNAPLSYVSAFLLFSALPSGVASPAITDLLGGDVPLSVVITVFSHFVSTVSIPILFFILLRRVIRLDYLGIFLTMAKLILLPLVVSIFFRKFFKLASTKIAEKGRLITIIPLLLVSFAVMSINHDFIIHNPWQTVKYVLISYPLYFFFLLSNYLFTLKFPNKQRITFSVTKTFTNVTIGTVLAVSFLSPKEALIVTMAQIPWSTMILPAELLNKVFLRKNQNNEK